MKSILAVLFVAVSMPLLGAQNKPLNMEEVLSVIRTNMVDITPEELGHNAALGLIRQLGTKVQLVQDGTNASSQVEHPDPVSKATVYEGRFGYIRIKTVEAPLTNEFRRRLSQLLSSNEIAGLVIDLRFAQGTNYDAAAAVADEFVSGRGSLVKLGDRQLSANAQPTDINKPLAVLVNSNTRAAAEALAGILRESAAALVIGNKTAGEARLYEIFTLTTGHRLRVGKVPIEVGNGKSIPSTGITPDIEVNIAAEEEIAFYQDPFRERSAFTAGTNSIPAFAQGRALNEAELVRRHRDGDNDEPTTASPRRASPEVAVVTDPTLARALDFLKGISLWQPRR